MPLKDSYIIQDHRHGTKTARLKEIPFQPSTLETVDYAVYKWLDEELNLFTSMHEGWKKVPVIWAAAERSFQVKNNKDLRDEDGTLIFPLITIERTNVVKDLSKKGSIYANVPPVDDEKGGTITVARRIQQKKTSNFANADTFRRRANGRVGIRQQNFPRNNKKIVYETITIPIPVYLDITYTIAIKTEYQQQMNELVTPFMTTTGGINYFTVNHDGHRFESFIQGDINLENNISSMEEEHRKYKTKIDIKTLGYIIGEDKNQEQPKIVIRENAVEVKFPRERVIYGDIPSYGGHKDKAGHYRE